MATTSSKKPVGPIPLDYFKDRDLLERWKLWLSGLALALVAIWAVTGFIWSAWGNHQSSPGPIAAVHATWETQCNACHEQFKPIRGQFLFWSFHDSDQKCRVCHAGPAHHESQTPELACASCHREHRGPEASLVRIPDSACTQCHANLAGHVKTGAERVVVPVDGSFKQEMLDHVEGFDLVNHPRFQSAAKDPGKLAFNHKLHMSAGMDVENKGDPKWTFAKIPYTADWKRYATNPSKEDVVQLKCSSCHCLDSGDFRIPNNRLEGVPASVLRPRSPGAYFLPITYENQCRPCHVLTATAVDDPLSPEIVIPHRLQPCQVHDFLWGVFVNHYDRGKHKEHFQKKLSNLKSKDKMAEENRKDIDLEEGIEFIFQKKVERIERVLYPEKQTCRECHSYVGDPHPVPKAIAPPNVPEVWLQRALFNHAAHRAVDCLECHEKALTSYKSEDVLLPDIDTCVKCHAPGKGARFDCTECHRYHDGAQRRRNDSAIFFGALGSSRRDPKNKMNRNEFQRGP